jgi:CheY-like chemotaxis protein
MSLATTATTYQHLGRPIRILLVEDSPSDRHMTIAALREGRILNETYVAVDGAEALDFVHRQGKHAAAPRPDLIILDLNLPKKDGRQVLSELKADPDLKSIPVVVLTTSSAESDITASYRLQAAGYVAKPVEINAFLRAVKGIEDFWLAVVLLPGDHSAGGA